jgi:transcriptional/translational regulatory protein YebC/TACO1
LLILQLYFSEGGSSDPNFNAQLSSTIAQARKYNMPLASIQNAIKQSKVPDNRTFILIVLGSSPDKL